MKVWLDEAKVTGTPKVFIYFDTRRSAGRASAPSLATNPHRFLSSYAKDLDIIVFNGHVHTTEL